MTDDDDDEDDILANATHVHQVMFRYEDAGVDPNLMLAGMHMFSALVQDLEAPPMEALKAMQAVIACMLHVTPPDQIEGMTIDLNKPVNDPANGGLAVFAKAYGQQTASVSHDTEAIKAMHEARTEGGPGH